MFLPCPFGPLRSLPRRLLCSVIIAGLAALLPAQPLEAAHWHVDCETGVDTNSGQPNSPFATIQTAIKTARDGDVIELHPRARLPAVRHVQQPLEPDHRRERASRSTARTRSLRTVGTRSRRARPRSAAARGPPSTATCSLLRDGWSGWDGR